jgi:glutamine amidotransferase
MADVGILDIEMGNLRSLSNAVYSLGFDPVVVHDPAALSGVDRLLIPGVGSYGAAMANVGRLGFTDPLRRFAESGRPLLGICLGMQILSARGAEGGTIDGLGLVPGEVVLLDAEPKMRLPHVGWNAVSFRAPHPVLQGIRDGKDFYFVHSYAFRCAAELAYADTEYGQRFASIVGRGNVVGVQFHPEKSQRNGLQLLENFCRWNGTC